MTPEQWTSLGQVLWVQDFPRGCCPSHLLTCAFTSTLHAFVSSLIQGLEEPLGFWLTFFEEYDFSGSNAALVASRVGIARPPEPVPVSLGARHVGRVNVALVGESFCDYALPPGRNSVFLLRDRANSADPNAIAVHFVSAQEPRQRVGFLPAKDAAVLAPLLDGEIVVISSAVGTVTVSGARRRTRVSVGLLLGDRFPNGLCSKDGEPRLTNKERAALGTLTGSMFQRPYGLHALHDIICSLGMDDLDDRYEDEHFCYLSSSVGTSIDAEWLSAFVRAAGRKVDLPPLPESEDTIWPMVSVHDALDDKRWEDLETRAQQRELRTKSRDRRVWGKTPGLMVASVADVADVHDTFGCMCLADETAALFAGNDRLWHLVQPAARQDAPRFVHHHSKMLLRSCRQINADSSAGLGVAEGVGWVYVGSHNFSPAAWGRQIDSSGALLINNWELGVVLASPPPLHTPVEAARSVRDACWDFSSLRQPHRGASRCHRFHARRTMLPCSLTALPFQLEQGERPLSRRQLEKLWEQDEQSKVEQQMELERQFELEQQLGLEQLELEMAIRRSVEGFDEICDMDSARETQQIIRTAASSQNHLKVT